MHQAVINFIKKVKTKYPAYFNGMEVLDVGSYNVNGTNRQFFVNCDYLGLDLEPGDNVDIACLVHEFKYPAASFGTIICTDMLEHDPYFKESVTKMVKLLKPGGMLLITCATTGRLPHGVSYARPEDSPFSAHWGYYENRTVDDLSPFLPEEAFNERYFEVNTKDKDLYFYGIKK